MTRILAVQKDVGYALHTLSLRQQASWSQRSGST
jgi:hypothetical protein